MYINEVMNVFKIIFIMQNNWLKRIIVFNIKMYAIKGGEYIGS